MKIHQFQTVLIVAMSIGLGVSLTSKDAIGYPSAAAISSGVNPVVSTGGSISVDTTTALLEAPSDQDVIVTDYAFDPDIADQTCVSIIRLKFQLAGSGVVLGQRSMTTHFWGTSRWEQSSIDTSLESGLRIPAGETLNLVAESRYVDGCSARGVAFSVSGYLAQP
jgi:hypothetical protein